jgi:inorganic pyrophosphatase
MPRVIVHVDTTVGSSMGKGSDARREPWPVGRGEVRDTLTDDGQPADALVLIPERAVLDRDVPAWPVAVLHLEGDPPHDTFLCVCEDPSFLDLVDLPDLARWHASTPAWLASLDRLEPDHRHLAAGCGPKAEADHLLTEAGREYLRLTGRLD